MTPTLDEQIAWCELGDKAPLYKYLEMLPAILATLREAKAAQAQQPVAWISVKDRLPDVDGMMVAVHAPEAALCDVWPAKWDADNKSFSADNGWFETDEVTHWMPLPAAPKEPTK